MPSREVICRFVCEPPLPTPLAHSWTGIKCPTSSPPVGRWTSVGRPRPVRAECPGRPFPSSRFAQSAVLRPTSRSSTQHRDRTISAGAEHAALPSAQQLPDAIRCLVPSASDPERQLVGYRWAQRNRSQSGGKSPHSWAWYRRNGNKDAHLLDDLLRERQNGRRYVEAECLCSTQIQD